MKIKKYVGSTMQDAIFKVKADLGPEAIIIDTRKFKKGFLGLFGKTQIEVLAALEEDKLKENDNNKTLEEISDLKDMVYEFKQQWKSDDYLQELPEKSRKIYQQLNLQGVNKDFCREFILELNESSFPEEEIIKAAADRIVEFLNKPSPIEVKDDSPSIIAFIGPTGVGKTTTIAKLAARFTLDQNKKVGLITADTYRIAAVQQLETYSDIIDIPLSVVYNKKELKEIIEDKYKDYDLIFLDTAGSSWNDQMQLGRLQEFINHKYIDEVHLILSMNTRSRDVQEIIDKFSSFNPDKILLSKFDETTIFGDLINIKHNYGYSYSYITDGQDVPDDLQVADPELLTEYIMGDIHD